MQDSRNIWFSETLGTPQCPAHEGSCVTDRDLFHPPQAESTRRRDVGQPRSAGFRRREEDAADADADAEAAAAERRRLQRVAVVSQLAQSGGKAAPTPPV